MRRYIILVISIFFLLLFIGSPLRHVYAPFKYRGLIKHYAEKYGLDWLLVSSIIYHESRFRYYAVSNKGARGLMQIMPETGLEVARKLGWEALPLDDIFKPRVNLELGCYYFKSLLKEFNNDHRLALVAYNAGRGSIYRCYSTDKNNLSYPSAPRLAGPGAGGLGYPDIQKYLYPETRCYVSKVNSTYRLLKLLDKVWRL